MASSFTTNKNLEEPANGDYVDTWNVPMNRDFTYADTAFGGRIAFNATAGSQTLTSGYSDAYSYIPLMISISGAISAGTTYTIPSGVGGHWIIYNSTTDASGGPWAITVASGGGGTSVIIPRLSRIIIMSDGTNITTLGYLQAPGGNLSVAGSITSGTSITAGTTVVAGTTSSDALGNLREVPPNSQTTGYTLVATDSGKYVSITTGGVTVPPSIFSAGQTVSIFNNSTSNQTISQGSGVTMYLGGTATTGNRILAQYGVCTVLCVGSNTFVAIGAGLS